jgi:hypothetical protein
MRQWLASRSLVFWSCDWLFDGYLATPKGFLYSFLRPAAIGTKSDHHREWGEDLLLERVTAAAEERQLSQIRKMEGSPYQAR